MGAGKKVNNSKHLTILVYVGISAESSLLHNVKKH